MKDLLDAIRSHAQTDGLLGSREGRAALLGDRREEARYARARRMNDLAHFLLAFGLFETRMNQLCLGLTQNRRIQDLWPHGRGWAAARPDFGIIVRLSFPTKLAWLTGKDGREYAGIMELLEFRNKLAYGPPPDTAVVFQIAARRMLDFLARAEAELAEALV